MKAHLLIGILLLICAQCAHSAAIPAKREISESNEEGLAELNKARRQVAVALGIDNMQVMVFDKGYEEMVKKANCENPPKGNFVFFKVPTEEEMMQLQFTMAKILREIPEGKKRKEIALKFFFDALGGFFIPTISKIGCVENKCGNGACIMGPLARAKAKRAAVIFKEPAPQLPTLVDSEKFFRGSKGSSVNGNSLASVTSSA